MMQAEAPHMTKGTTSGTTIPHAERKKKNSVFTLSVEARAKLERMAAARGVSMTALLEGLIRRARE